MSDYPEGASPQKRILVVEDEEDILAIIHFNLMKAGYQVVGADTGEEAWQQIQAYSFDLVILDIMLPGINGLDLCKQLKSHTEYQELPIIMLTAKGEESDIINGLEAGADDYVTKPFSPKVLLARIHAVLKRSSRQASSGSQVIEHGEMLIHPGYHQVTIAEKVIDLTFTEFRILYFLAKHPGWVYTRHQIVEGVRGSQHYVTDRSVDVQITNLRKKIVPLDHYIETVRGIGYRFKEPTA